MKIILEGITGSKAYGLDTSESDTDMKGIFIAPTEEILSLNKPKDTIDNNDPDVCYHEVEKFMKLALRCNPTILELLYLNDYSILTEEGKSLVDNRKYFLSNIAFKSYGGYAISQVRKLHRRGESFSSPTKNRYAKHARHCYRLLDQGRQILETGTLKVKVKNRDELFAIGKLPVDALVNKFEKDFKEFDKIKSILPDKPNIKKINKILVNIRKNNFLNM